ncbi:photosystem I assembly protein Ycf3 [Symmachiella macrocystis]|uniref:Photosystem I assembly protein Ycf3 n=1 Tax=Symmachiella macrocystis TaxID=2527985 RepID=A0A5C6BRR7_9PLAN|nr:multiheme c-type cytochrome [Symmachiella macrocystis]TWU14111.1 photosystem I assembly protein Ycf3 [Symmachiella macrocystis]
MKKRIWIGLILAVAILAIIAWPALDWYVTLPEGRTATFVGRQSCIECHSSEYKKWQGSDHDLAMDLATPEFVLGDFNDTQLEHHGIVSKMQRRGDDYFVETQGPDGETAEFQVKYVFGYHPLQQYLTELERGQVQVLPVTWDTEEKRWYYANPDAPFGPDDPLHWTGSAQNWNHMCADCHSTNFAKNYDVKTDTHNYSFHEMDVSCEACHGPGSIHEELANSSSLFWDRHYGYGLAKLKGPNARAQLETCAPCHSHRQHIHPGFQPGEKFLDHFNLSLLEDHLYHADGQIDEEVYVYGSFLQSLMYRKGVRCTDCHDPHSTKLKFEGNKLCTQCHLPAKYDGPNHHHHKIGTDGASCVECHMPSKKYMVVDPRRDHSLRVPRPDLTVKIGTPNACNGCHTKPEESPQWAADKIVEWYGPKRRQDPHYGEIIDAGRKSAPSAVPKLAKLARNRNEGAIVRATAVSLLATRFNTAASRTAVYKALEDGDPLVRTAALRLFEGWQPRTREEADEQKRRLAPLLKDASRLVRVTAARLLSGLPPGVLNSTESQDLAAALAEYQAGLNAHTDQSGVHLSLGLLYANQGKPQQSAEEYRTAIRLEPSVAGPRSNLAGLLEQQGETDEVRKLREEEAEILARDARLLPNNATIHYRLGLVNYLLGREEQATTALERAYVLDPTSPDFLMMLTLLYEKQEQWDKAVDAADRLMRLQPGNRMFLDMKTRIEQGAAQRRRPRIGPPEKAGN